MSWLKGFSFFAKAAPVVEDDAVGEEPVFYLSNDLPSWPPVLLYPNDQNWVFNPPPLRDWVAIVNGG